MEIPVCPGCGGSRWDLFENYAGCAKHYELQAAGWTLIDDELDLDQSDYLCRDCDYDADDGNNGGALWNLLNDIDTAPTADAESGRPTEDLQLRLWEDDRLAA